MQTNPKNGIKVANCSPKKDNKTRNMLIIAHI